MTTTRFNPRMFRNLFMLTILAIAAGYSPREAAAQTPTATGTLRSSNLAALGTVEVFNTSSNAFGFWLRLRFSNGDVVTAAPFEMTPAGELRLWFIHYSIVGGTDPARAPGWAWVERYSGRISVTLAGATAAGISGTMFYQSQGTQNTRRIPIDPVHSFPFVLTFP